MNTLPKTDSISKLAEFWDTHDLTEFEEELEEVKEPVFMQAKHITIFLSSKDAKVLHSLAIKRGVSDSELVSRWVHDHVK